MKKYFFIFILTYIFVGSPINAAVYKGYKVYTRVCIKCHTSGQSFIATKTIYNWKKLMKKKGMKLKTIHFKTKKAKRAWKYFASNKYTKKTKSLQEFLVEYAKDSGNVPACN